MKFPLLLVTLLLFASPVVALPTKISCSESDGIIIKESNEVMDSFGSTSAKMPVCKSDEYSLNCSGEAALYGEDSPYTIEFNLDTQEAVVNRDYETRFYTVEATEDQIRLIRKRRPLDESTYQSTGSQIFYSYSIVISRNSLSSVYTEIVDTTDWSDEDDGGFLYTTIINGSCKNHPSKELP